MPNIAGSMKDWEYTFDPVSKTDWIRQIEVDLRQKPISSLHSEWWPGEALSPLLHTEDYSGEPIRLPDHLFEQPPRITEFINLNGFTTTDVNRKILEALKYGAQSIILHPGESENLFQKEWFADVLTEIVTLAIQVKGAGRETFKNLISSSPAYLLHRIERSTGTPLADILDLASNSGHQSLYSMRFVYHLPAEGAWDLSTANVFNTILDDFNTWTNAGLNPESFFNQVILSIEASQFYFKHIIQTRVIHLLWLNLLNHHSIGFTGMSSHPVECHIEQHADETPQHFLIRASTAALAAAMSGTDALCLHHSDQPGMQSFYRRINRNIHHLLNLECDMYKGRDPISGAFAIDLHARNWTRNIWDKLLLEK